jgi:hypothetical protein
MHVVQGNETSSIIQYIRLKVTAGYVTSEDEASLALQTDRNADV